MEIRRKLEQKFSESDLKWRVQSCGKNNAGVNWAKFIPYIDPRVIQKRFDDLFGWDGWESKEYINEDHSVTVELSLYSLKANKWITRAGTADIASKDSNSIKSAASSAFKRAASMFGVGRYLYNYKEVWGDIVPDKTPGSIMCENKSKGIKFYATPKIPKGIFQDEKTSNMSNLKTQEIGKERAIELYKKLQETYKDSAEKAVKQLYLKFGIEKLEFLSENQLTEIETAKYDVLEIKVS